MARFNPDSIPKITITRHIHSESDTPSLHSFEVLMNSNDYGNDEDDSLSEEIFAKANIVLFDPRLGNPTDDADASSQELFDVSTAFYDPDGELSTRTLAMNHGENEDAETPLAYIQNISLLKGFEKGGRLEVGLALALKQIATDFGCSYFDVPLMVAAYDDKTVRLVDGADVDGTEWKHIPFGKNFGAKLGLSTWVGEGQSFASEIGHGAAAGLLLDDATNHIIGHGTTISGNTLLGISNFDCEFDIDQRQRSEREIAKHFKLREDANGFNAPDHEPSPAKNSLSASIAALRDSLAATDGILTPTSEETEAILALAQEAIAKFAPSKLANIGDKVKAKRATAAKDPTTKKPNVSGT